ncbi:MAG: DUF4097 family beta strand repeat-containing protein [Aristaeellaceae bacterium]
MNRNESFSALTVSTLCTRLGWASLEVMVDDAADIQVLLSGDESEVAEMKVALQDGKLLVEQPSYGLSTRIHASKWMQVFIRLPRSWKGAADVSSVTGGVNVRGVTGTDLKLETVSGDVRAMSLTGLHIALHTVSGDILASDLAGDSCALRTVSGKVRLTDCGFGAYHISNVSGDVSLELVSGFEKLEGVTVSGDVCIHAPIARADASLRAVTGRLLTEGVSIGPDAPRVAMSSVSANLQLICTLEQA